MALGALIPLLMQLGEDDQGANVVLGQGRDQPVDLGKTPVQLAEKHRGEKADEGEKAHPKQPQAQRLGDAGFNI